MGAGRATGSARCSGRPRRSRFCSSKTILCRFTCSRRFFRAAPAGTAHHERSLFSRGRGMATAPLNRILGHLRVSVADVPDAELLQAFLASRDSGAFATIVRRHGPTVLNACRQVLRQESDVEDAFQATFVVLLKSGEAIKSRQSLGS